MWHFYLISVTLIHEKVWVTDPNHSDRRSTWPQQRKQHQRSVARRQLQQLHQRSAARRQQLRRQLQSAARRQQLRRQLQSAAARRQQQLLLQRSAAARRQLRSNYQLKKPATLCGGFFYADFIRRCSHYEKMLLSVKKFQIKLFDPLSISDQEIESAHLQRGQGLQRQSPSNP